MIDRDLIVAEEHAGCGAVRSLDGLVSRLHSQIDLVSWPFVAVSDACKLLGVTVLGSQQTISRGRLASRASHHSGSLSIRDGRPVVRLSSGTDRALGRLTVAHEIGHLLLNFGEDCFLANYSSESQCAKLMASADPAEEALAEYAGRRLLMPASKVPSGLKNRAAQALSCASNLDVTLHAAVVRLADRDLDPEGVLHAAVLWRSRRDSPSEVSPHWFACPTAFIPVNRGRARAGSVVARVAAEDGFAADIASEEVSIGEFRGQFLVHAIGWGNRAQRVVLSFFEAPLRNSATGAK